MTEKMYGLDDIPEGWVLEEFRKLPGTTKHIAHIKIDAVGLEESPQLALHKAIQRARGEG